MTISPWLMKEEPPLTAPPRSLGPLCYASELSYGDQLTDNLLVQGDNLDVLQALRPAYAGRVKCIYIDPPYNTGGSFLHYHDALHHSAWLAMMRPRLELLWRMLRDDGLLVVQIDDNEYARLFLLLADICGEQNLKTIVVKMAEPTGVKMSQVIKHGGIPKLKEYLILAGKSGVRGLQVERLPKEQWDNEYRIVVGNVSRRELEELKAIIDDDMRSVRTVERADVICQRLSFEAAEVVCLRETQATLTEAWLRENAWRLVRTVATTLAAKALADGKRNAMRLSRGAFVIETRQKKLYVIKADYRADRAQPRIRVLFADDYLTFHPGDFWHDIKTTGLGDEGGVDFLHGKKPEELLRRIIGMATRPGDLVLDAFAGSGTTGAVAQKMGRRFILIESGAQAVSHCAVRLRRVIDGERGGISKIAHWQGGGGFRFYRLEAVDEQ